MSDTAHAPQLLAARLQIPPISYSHAAGSWIFASNGERYLDASSGIINVNIGHAHPTVVEAMRDQVGICTYASPGSLLASGMEQLAVATARAVHRPHDRVMFTPTGTHASESAIALARLAQRSRGEKNRHKVLTASLGYHGNSAFVLALSGHRSRRPHEDDSFGIGPAFDPPYPGQHLGCPFPTCRTECVRAVRDAIVDAGPDTVAAVLLEPVNGTTGGGYTPPPGYLRALREVCDEYGVLLIHDEVLTGLGRTGLPLASHHAQQAEQAQADIVTLSKGLGAGFVPLAATMISPDLAESILSSGAWLPLMGTMSATPLQARVGLAVLSVLDEIGALDRDQVRGAAVTRIVTEVTRDLPVVTDVRGVGFFHGIELARGTVGEALRITRSNGLLLYPFVGYRRDGSGEGLLVAPPLNATEADLDHLGRALRTSLVRLNETVG
ncbi:aminotransferase class III-fold pyridoxal phosphate-dependent enzyme [Micromonospora rifamycinica]|uniref:N(6)-acetyl-beta-lysine transaminase n=1 Tax=Micromonospora rifamycinica TaxID=291594 RepID=A0A125Q1K7_9ACTN|nr:aspartate aminotransferase family protein [Micromonospora rifamycinica]KWV32451.1 aminotransferase class III [Micromonospora rifamycinica]SCG35608.1 N(6)-acetyl-beta-lysine transaminase precursor [Micromonospora rifamycinica]